MLGLLLGVLGVGVLVGWSPLKLTPMILLSSLAAIGSAFCFGFSSVFARKYSRGSPLPTVTGQLLAGALFLVVPALANPPLHPVTWGTVILVIIVSVVATAIGNLMFFYLIDSAGSTQASSVGFLVPLFGIFWSWLFLDEPLTWSIVVGLALILLSVALVNNVLPLSQKATPSLK
jgi:drug/metabolite transporter (DMT)-like permease